MDQQERFKRLYANMKNYESSKHAELEKLQDGAIIGDGRSDSTLETKFLHSQTQQSKLCLA
ncbi:hypothetical protein VN1225_08680 [Helicobacter pylori]|nr:hypothetical protein VN1225_08680 [Helicobacter pylori]